MVEFQLLSNQIQSMSFQQTISRIYACWEIYKWKNDLKHSRLRNTVVCGNFCLAIYTWMQRQKIWKLVGVYICEMHLMRIADWIHISWVNIVKIRTQRDISQIFQYSIKCFVSMLFHLVTKLLQTHIWPKIFVDCALMCLAEQKLTFHFFVPFHTFHNKRNTTFTSICERF